MENRQAGMLATQCKQLPLAVGYPPAGPESTGMTACRTPLLPSYLMITHRGKIRAPGQGKLWGICSALV